MSRTITKFRKLLSAIGISLTAFFELCLTGRADRAWRMARADNRLNSLSVLIGGMDTPTEHRQPLPGHYSIFIEGAGITPPTPAPQLSRKVSIGMHLAKLIFLVFCISTIVTCPDGRTHLKEDRIERTAVQQAASGMGKEAPSSSPDRTMTELIVLGFVVCSYTAVFIYVVMRQIKQKTEHRRQYTE